MIALRPLLLVAACIAPAAAGGAEPAKPPFTPADLVRLNRLSDPQVSPDGTRVAYVQRSTDMAANRGNQDVWLIELATAGAQPRALTTATSNDSSPRWAPDGRALYFMSTRSGSSQVWRLALDGGEAQQVTDYPLDVTSFKVAPAGGRLVLSIDVFPDCRDLQCTKQRLEKLEKAPSGLVYDKLFVRHWDTWSDGRRSHLFVAHIGTDGRAAEPAELAPGIDADTPSKPNGGDEEYAVSPDGRKVVFSARIAGRTEPWSTNFDLFEVDVAAPGGAPRNLTEMNAAWDTQPVFLRDGRLAYLAMERPGFESDRFHVMLREASGSTRELAREWDRSVGRLGTTWDGRTLLATADDMGQAPLFSIDTSSGKVTRLTKNGQVTEFAAAPAANGRGNGAVVAWASLAGPPDLFRVSTPGAEPARLTAVNAQVLAARDSPQFEQFTFAGWNDETVHGYVMKPAGFDAAKKYPIAFIVHGGPQVAMGNSWSYRWSELAFSGAGYGVVFIDFHGTPGYGQQFTDSISRDWGGKPFIDLQKGLAAATAKYPWLDADRACALGASYGGFMMNWIAGNWPERFRCIVNHDGIFDSRAMYYTTEELWFEEWDHGGVEWENPQNYQKFNPVNHVANWRTPMLVIQGEQDFRVPDGQGIGTFTALQRKGIPSKLLYFPDENHWVLKPKNSEQWYATVLGWLDQYLRQ